MRAAAARRGRVALAGAGTLLLLGLATAPWAGASTIYACVKKKGGAVHIVSRAARCNRREPKKSWDQKGPTGAKGAESVSGANGAGGLNGPGGVTGATGPAGGTTETGATGARGSNGVTGSTGATGGTGASGVTGTNGATGTTGASGPTGATGEAGTTGPSGAAGTVGGYSLRQTAGKNLPFTSGTKANPTTVVSRELPAGNYIVNAKVELQLSNTKAEGGGGLVCNLVDTPAEGGTPASDTAGWVARINVPSGGFFYANNSLPLTLAVSSASHTSDIAIACYVSLEDSGGGEFSATAANAVITAIQTTQNS